MQEVSLYGIKTPLTFDRKGWRTRVSLGLVLLYIGFLLYKKYQNRYRHSVQNEVIDPESISHEQIIQDIISQTEYLLSNLDQLTIKEYCQKLRHISIDLHTELRNYDIASYDQEQIENDDEIDGEIKNILLAIYHTPYKKTPHEKKEYLQTLTQEFIKYLKDIENY